MSQGQSPNSTYEWLAKSIREGSIKHYSEDDIADRTLIGHNNNGYGVVYKAKIKHSGKPVAMKALLNRHGDEESYKDFVKKVVNVTYFLIIA